MSSTRWRIDEAGEKALEGVAAHEQTQPLPILEMLGHVAIEKNFNRLLLLACKLTDL